jgi:enamine deaminase RidA (YjgF/YER057c/UK114 family)
VLHPGDPYEQAKAAFGIALDALERAGARREQTVRTRMYVVGRDHQAAVGRAHAVVFGAIRPVATMVLVAGLADADHLVEVEVEAYLGPHEEAV